MPYLRDSSDDREPHFEFEVTDSSSPRSAEGMNRDGLHSLKSLASRGEKIGCALDLRDVIQTGLTSNQTSEDAKLQDVTPESRPSGSLTVAASPRKLRVDPCPVRLTPMAPPVNYGTVERGMMYRSGFPDEHNINFIESLGIRSIMTLVETTPSDEYYQYIHGHGINRAVISIAPNKEGRVSTTTDSLCEALLFALDSTHYPLYIHCNQGRHRTGCIVGCLRRIQQWPLDEILAEYEAYASPKARPGDIELIRSFDPEVVFRYASSKGVLCHSDRSTRMPLSRLAGVYSLTSDLPRHEISQLDDSASESGLYALHSSVRRSHAIQHFTFPSFALTESKEDHEEALEIDEAEDHRDTRKACYEVQCGPTNGVLGSSDHQPLAMSRHQVATPPSPVLASAPAS